MKEIIKMLVVLTGITGVCGFFLAGVRDFTKDQIQEQELTYVKGPAVKKVLEGCDNDPIKDRIEVVVEGETINVFIGKKDGKPWAVAYETSSAGFGGDIGVMMGVGLEDGALTDIGITTHKETPGLGSRVTEDAFSAGFKGKPLDSSFKVTGDGGIIDAISGATVSSKGVCAAVTRGAGLFGNIKTDVTK